MAERRAHVQRGWRIGENNPWCYKTRQHQLSEWKEIIGYIVKLPPKRANKFPALLLNIETCPQKGENVNNSGTAGHVNTVSISK
jgi:hypothetical protein